MRVAILFTIAVALSLAASSVSASRPEYVSTPVGRVLKECNHRVPSGSHLSPLPHGGLKVTDRHGKFLKVIPACNRRNGTLPLFEPSPLTRRRQHAHSSRGHSRKLLQFPPDYEGWLAYTAFEYADGFDAFWGNFSVPDQPANVPDVLYLFTGLQNIDWIPIVDPEPSTPFDIIQPVLQYPGDEGNYWSVKSWYVTLDVGTVASDEVQLNVGDVIFGNMTRTGPTGWYIGSTSVQTGNTTYVTVDNDRLASQPWAYNTLECYGCSGCGTFPDNACQFRDLLLVSKGNVIVPQWKINPKPSKNKQCKEIPVVNDPTSVDIDFGNSA